MIKIDEEKCIGCGTCTAVCDKVFKLNEETMKAEAINSNAEDDCVKEAVEMCPTDAIEIE